MGRKSIIEKANLGPLVSRLSAEGVSQKAIARHIIAELGEPNDAKNIHRWRMGVSNWLKKHSNPTPEAAKPDATLGDHPPMGDGFVSSIFESAMLVLERIAWDADNVTIAQRISAAKVLGELAPAGASIETNRKALKFIEEVENEKRRG